MKHSCNTKFTQMDPIWFNCLRGIEWISICELVCVWLLAKTSGQVFGHLDFKIVVEPADTPAFTVVLLAPSRQEKAAWTSDISQVKEPSEKFYT